MFYHASKLLSYNAIFNFVNTNRNYGKTWGFKRRAVVRALKHGKKTIWLRRFKKETRECLDTFFKSKDLQEFCGVSIYDKDTNPHGNLKRVGNVFYIKRGKKWVDFLKVITLSDANAMRSADDVDVDTIVFDEYTTTPEKYNLYRGNEVEHFIDIFFSAKRNHKVICVFLGNKESHFNPYFNYFNIKPLPYTYEGIKTYRNNSIAVEQRNNKSIIENEYQEQCFELFKDTKYGDYIYKSTYKQNVKIKQSKPPQNAYLYVQLHFNNINYCIKRADDLFYVTNKINLCDYVYSDYLQGYSKEKQLLKRHKTHFTALLNAVSDNRVYYDSEVSFETFQTFLKWLGTI